MKGQRILFHSIISYAAIVLGFSCSRPQSDHLFTRLPATQTGVHFNNEIRENDSSHSFINEFGYMGGGVGIGDFNNDGKKDLFFTGNQVTCRLYINKGNNQFQDITDKAGLKTDVWCTGVSIVDINNDGYDDIYVCVFGKNLLYRAKNLLFINQHDLTFREEAEAYGLADSGYSTQAVFFDYDKDGKKDMFLVNYLLGVNNANEIFPRDRSGYSPANDKLYHNEGDSARTGHPVFKDVSLKAGIREDGYGLGVVASDFNNDGWPDIYVANDFLSNDELWLNNHNGSFTNVIARAMNHQSYSSMGADAADINNDALPDVVTLDMLPEINERKKISFSVMNHDRYEHERSMGYEPEFMRNMLQLNNGNIKMGDTLVPFFSEIGQLAGIQATDWSWSVLLADFNNDGWKDMHITNGIGRDFINADFLEFSNDIFNSSLSRSEQQEAIRKKLASLKHINLPNYLFMNRGNLTFSDESEAGGINEPSMSNGAAYADLDNDGDLDLVVNNINSEPFIFINNTNQQNKAPTVHFLSIGLKGDSLNGEAMGTKVFVYDRSGVQMQEENPVRGYFSSVDRQLIFGLGENDHVDSLIVVWPDDKKQVITNLRADTSLILSWKNAVHPPPAGATTLPTLFSDISSSAGIYYQHQDNPFNDYAIQRLFPQKFSQLGPFIATGDMDKNGLTDFFIGEGVNFSGKLFSQQEGSSFTSKNLTDSVKWAEDMACILFDADLDGDQDLLVTDGDIRFEEGSVFYQPRLYLNDGKGNFSLAIGSIPEHVKTIAGTVSAGDLDGDGDLDIFIGGRVSRNYPGSPQSFILRNDKGIFTDVTASVCPALSHPGMVTSSVWADLDHDNHTDLIIAGEWMPIRFFRNDHGRLTETTDSTGLTDMNGMWRSLIAADIDDDGDIDLVAGNLGLNCDFRVSPKEPMTLYAADLDGNGIIDPVLFYYIKGADGEKHSFPGVSRSRLSEQVPSVKKQFLHYSDYAKAGYDELFKGKAMKNLQKFSCDETRTCYFENNGHGRFIKHPLPVEAQFAPVNAILCDDMNGDGKKDLLLAGNEYQTDVITGRYDASYGCFLKGNGNGKFTTIPPVLSGFILRGDVKDLSMIRLSDGEEIILAAVNNDSLKVFRVNSVIKKAK